MFETRSKGAARFERVSKIMPPSTLNVLGGTSNVLLQSISWPIPIEKEIFKGNYNTLSISFHIETKGSWRPNQLIQRNSRNMDQGTVNRKVPEKQQYRGTLVHVKQSVLFQHVTWLVCF